MSITVGASGGNKTVTAVTVGTSGGNKAVLNAYVGTATGNQLVFSAFSASASPNSVSGFRSGPGIATSNSTTATPNGGTGSYTYAWRRVSGDVGVTAGLSTSATTTFQATVGPGETVTAEFVCDVTDTGLGVTEATNSVFITLEDIGSG